MLFEVFSQTVLPVFLIAAAAALLSSLIALDVRSLGRAVFYLGTPCLIFRSLYQTTFDWGTLQRLAGVSISVMFITGLTSWLISKGLERKQRAAIVLTSAMSNNGNMGLPICLFAFGEVGLALATVYYITTSIVGNTLGVVVASAGRMPLGAAILSALQAPMLYAALLGLGCNLSGWQLPVGLFRAIDILADAAIPLMLMVLGVQLRTSLGFHRPWLVLRSVAVRLLIGPLAAVALCWLFGIADLERDVMILQASMPTAVITSVVANEYDAAPDLVATDIFISTLLSLVTLSLILWWMVG